MSRREPLDRDEWRAIIALLVLFVPNTLFWATYEQQGNTIALWADANTDRTIDLLVWPCEIPTTWFQAFNPAHDLRFHAVRRRAVDAAGGARHGAFDHHQDGARLLRRRAGLPVMALAAWHAGGGKASWLWLFGYFVVITVGELYLSPVGLSLVTKVAPARILSMMMGVWLATSFVGNFLAGWLGSFWSRMDKPEFFLIVAAIAALASAAIFACRWPLRGRLGMTSKLASRRWPRRPDRSRHMLLRAGAPAQARNFTA